MADACAGVGDSAIESDEPPSPAVVACDLQESPGPTDSATGPSAATDEAQKPRTPLTWAERAAKAAPKAAPGASLASPGAAEPGVAVGGANASGGGGTGPVKKSSIVDYWRLLADRKAAAAVAAAGLAGGEPASPATHSAHAEELPEELRKYEECLDASVGTTTRATYSRLGMRNDANNCYVNVVVQSLLPCSALMWFLSNCVAEDAGRPFISCLVGLFKAFHARKPESHGEVLNVLVQPGVKELISAWQRLGAQQDAGEFLLHLLSGLHEESKWVSPSAIVAASQSESPKPDKEDEEESGGGGGWAQLVRSGCRQAETRSSGRHDEVSPITRIFGGEIQSAVRSRGAEKDSVSLEPFNRLDLDISQQNVSSLRGALEAFCNAESVRDGQATRRLRFKTLPKVLVVSLKRFTYNRERGAPQKVKKAIRYDEKLVFDRNWLVDGTEPLEYFVTAIICHHGDSVQHGHYSAIVRYNAEWYSYDDTVVRRVEHREVGAQQQAAYVLVYQSRGTVDMTP